MMSTLTALMMTLLTMVTFCMIPRIGFDWLRFREYAKEDDREKLLMLQRQENGWVIRHLACALCAVALVVAMKTCPNLGQPERLAAVTAVYAVISFCFALVESILSQRIYQFTVSRMEAVKQRSDD
ncbi:hypothetical protein F6V25_04945 [Oryzomonas japonica]|uniref:SdpI/YhfL protein family protein n=2 Tax=Oryzomonas TaxID=2855184 RepID=A0A5A9XQQ9_9BACT|nr:MULTISPECIES: hypothetical protein [Oryzomonas]KAA0895150.1 hypothetical protein ET418_01120 [Oryzomonas rubra]KAB0666767.1 hypothetical protein F6V25_04945 [Oryzomonas japonica]